MASISAGLHSLVYTCYGYSPQAGMPLLGFNAGWFDLRVKAYPLGNGYRFYSPSLSRFVSPDSSSPFAAGGINTYCYCLGDPINRYDSTGHVSEFWGRAMAAFRRSRIQRLPNEMLEQVVKKMPMRDAISFSSTSKRMRGVTSKVVERSQDNFFSKLLEEPGTQDKMVFALRVNYGLEKEIPPVAASLLKITTAQMDSLILDANRRHYAPQVRDITLRLENQAAIQEELLRPRQVHRALMQGIR